MSRFSPGSVNSTLTGSNNTVQLNGNANQTQTYFTDSGGVLRSMNGVRDGDSGSSSSRSGLIMFNGATYDRQYNNTQGTLLASAARTATTYTPVQTNYNARGVIIYLNVTSASGTGGLDVIVLSVDPISGNTFPINATPTSVTSTGLSTYVIYPGISGGSNTQSTSQILPRTWEIKMTQLDSSSYTYSLGYQLIL